MASLTTHPSRPLENGYHQSSPSSLGAKNLLASSWEVLEQPPPPSLREILGAYRARGDGDRDMLLAMLSAKSAEDQRIASVAALHRSMLEYYAVNPSASSTTRTHHVRDSSEVDERPFPPIYTNGRVDQHYSDVRTHSRARPYSSPDSPGADERNMNGRAKRHRSSASPCASYPSEASPALSASSVTPSSPRSDVSRSPISSRGTMAIDTLLHDAPTPRSERELRYAHPHHQQQPYHLPNAVAAV